MKHLTLTSNYSWTQQDISLSLLTANNKKFQNIIINYLAFPYRCVFSDKVSTEYTYYRLRNKNNFSILSINKAIYILESFKKSKFKNCCDDEVITAVEKWLTCVKGRLEKKNQLFYNLYIIEENVV
ncbi:DUF4806 domain-containing protein [Aphis craccivora]|uniref:DUF4806 domain-containing protein n=1 Tax=Aphis craccivora TaxID=307492 RepID=A0A6G0Y5A8_APHCR|nr:DUF4806 domain-containing protein [Aphis craccivora]